MMKSVLIVGIGNIGSRLYAEYQRLKPDRYDPIKGYEEKQPIRYDFFFHRCGHTHESGRLMRPLPGQNRIG